MSGKPWEQAFEYTGESLERFGQQMKEEGQAPARQTVPITKFTPFDALCS
jgi:hypothetical protein